MPQSWRMSRSVHERMIERAEAEYPDETCGFLFRTGSELEVVPMENIQNRLHAEDPVTYPRDARTAYYFDPGEMQRILTEKERAGAELCGIYHSHPDHDAYFSETDSAAAAPFGEPSYPGVVYLVYSVREGRAVDVKAFDWDETSGAYVEVPITID